MSALPPSHGSSSSSSNAAAIAASLAPSGSGTKRRFADPEYIAISEFLSSVGEVDEQDPHSSANGNNSHAATSASAHSAAANGASSAAIQPKRARSSAPSAARRAAAQQQQHNGGRQLMSAGKTRAARDAASGDMAELPAPRSRATGSSARGPGDSSSDRLDAGAGGDADDADEDNQSDKSSSGRQAASRHTKLTELEARVRSLERDNLHLKQTLLLGKNGSVMIAGRGSRENIQRLLSERTKVVTEMVDQLNASFLTIGDAARVWHEDCRIGVGVREWDAFGRLETISLWHMIRSVFATIAVDIVELRPHLPDGEMILTKWRIQGEIASQAQLATVCSSEDCPATMRVALMAIKSSDLTFTVTTYVIFQDTHIAEQHHCWDQVGVFKRLFGGEIPPSVHAMLAIEQEPPRAA